MKENMFKRNEEEVKEEVVNVKPETVSVSPETSTEQEIPFYIGFYSVDNYGKRGQLMDVLKDKGETRKCPCRSIALNLKDIKEMTKTGYTFVNADDFVFNKVINKKNVDFYIKRVSNMIKNGFIHEN